MPGLGLTGLTPDDPRYIKQNDTPTVRITLTENGVAANTTGWTDAQLAMRLIDDIDTVVVVDTVTFVSPRAGGQVDVAFAAGDTAVAGAYECEVPTVKTLGEVATFPDGAYFYITILDDIA